MSHEDLCEAFAEVVEKLNFRRTSYYTYRVDTLMFMTQSNWFWLMEMEYRYGHESQ